MVAAALVQAGPRLAQPQGRRTGARRCARLPAQQRHLAATPAPQAQWQAAPIAGRAAARPAVAAAAAPAATTAAADPSTLKAYLRVQNGSDVRGVAIDTNPAEPITLT